MQALSKHGTGINRDLRTKACGRFHKPVPRQPGPVIRHHWLVSTAAGQLPPHLHHIQTLNYLRHSHYPLFVHAWERLLSSLPHMPGLCFCPSSPISPGLWESNEVSYDGRKPRGEKHHPPLYYCQYGDWDAKSSVL